MTEFGFLVGVEPMTDGGLGGSSSRVSLVRGDSVPSTLPQNTRPLQYWVFSTSKTSWSDM